MARRVASCENYQLAATANFVLEFYRRGAYISAAAFSI